MKQEPVYATAQDLTSEQIKKLVKFCAENFDSHMIAPEEGLTNLAEEVGLTYKQKGKGKKTRTGELYVGDKLLVGVTLEHRSEYAKQVKEEGLGGWVAEGDWFGFTPLYLVDTLARRLANFKSWRMGRGGIWGDCLEALSKLAEPAAAVSN